MSAIDAVKAHYEERGRLSVDVPEWGLTVYWTPITPYDRRKIYKTGVEPTELATVDVLIQKATDADGKRLFTLDDRQDLLHRADVRVVNRVALDILEVPSVEDQEKN